MTFSFEPIDGTRDSFKLYSGRCEPIAGGGGMIGHGMWLCTVSDFDANSEQTRAAILEALNRRAAPSADSGWIACSARMPDNTDSASIDDEHWPDPFLTYPHWSLLRLIDGKWSQYLSDYDCWSPVRYPVTHWQPLPPPPRAYVKPEGA